MRLRFSFPFFVGVALLAGCAADSDGVEADSTETEGALSKAEIKQTIVRLRSELGPGDYEGNLTVDGRGVSNDMSCITPSCTKKHPAKCRIHVAASDSSYEIDVKTEDYWLYHRSNKEMSLTVDLKHSSDWYSTKERGDLFEVRYYHSQGLGGHLLRTVQFEGKKVSFIKREAAFKLEPVNTEKWECSSVAPAKSAK